MESLRWSRIFGHIGLAACITSCASDPSGSAQPHLTGSSSGASGAGAPQPGDSTSNDQTAPEGPGDSLPENQDPKPNEPEPTCDAPKLKCDGECINPDSDPKHCGAIQDCLGPNQGVTCAPGLVCSNGLCTANCAAGEILCNGGCVDPKSNKEFCGASLDCAGGNAGTVCEANQVCDAGVCTLSCGADEVKCNGECINPKIDKRFCGASLDCAGANVGQVCADNQVCAGGSCELECNAGTIECNNECINPLTDNRFCGAKDACTGDEQNGEVCPAGSICSNGECEVQCQPGLVECEGSCIDPKTDNNFCGADNSCGGATKCDPGKSCVDGACKMECPAGKIECNDQCIDPQTDNNFCGAQNDCKGPNAGAICSGDFTCNAGACELSCDADEVQCNGKCINPSTDEAFCGATADCLGDNAGKACDPSTHECIGGTCKPQCTGPQIACGDSCIDPRKDNNYCGATDPCDDVHNGEACSDKERCIAGVCTFYCDFPEINCGGTCIDPGSDVSNCGAVGNCAGANAGKACGAGEACINGICELQCKAGEIACDGRCVNPQTDRDYCGANAACNGGSSCGDGFICSAGECERDCPADQINCKDRCINPLTDNIYCGASDDCQDENSGSTCAVLFDQSCVNGNCELVCPPGKVACGERCIDPKTSQKHCGAKLDCAGTNAGATCKAPEQSCVAGRCEATGCGESEALARPEPVVIELILDKSGSMVTEWESSGQRETRWKSLHRAVLSLVKGYGPKAGKRGQAEFGALLFPARDAGLPYDGNTSRVCATGRFNNCTTVTDAWTSSNPYQSCRQADGSSENCMRDPYEVDSGLDPAWAPNANHDDSHFNSILPHADSQKIESRWSWSTYNNGNEANRMRRIGGGTPTAQAIRSAVTVLSQSRYAERKRVNILISDGATTGTSYSGSNCSSARAAALETDLYSVIRNAKETLDIPTYVVGVDLQNKDNGGGPGRDCSWHTVNPRAEANQMATAGGTGNALNVTDSAALNNAFNSILKDVLSCTIDIGDTPPYVNDVSVYFPNPDKSKGPLIKSFWETNGCANIPGAQAGWVYANSAKTKIELCHAACKDFKDRLTGELIVVKGCEGPE